MMISHGFANPSNDDYPRVKSPCSPQSRSNSNDALTNSMTQPIKPQSPPLSPVSPNSCKDPHTNAENSQFEEQLKHIQQKNNNMYLNGKENFNNTSIKISPAELMNGNGNGVQTNGHHLSQASITLNKSIQR